MAICRNCEKVGESLTTTLDFKERVLMLSSVASMMAFVHKNPNSTNEDKVVGSSVTTKLLLSFPGHQREALIRQLNLSTGIGINLKSCPHQGLSVVS